MAHIRDLLIPGMPCTQAYLPVEGRGLLYIRATQKNEKGGNLTLVQFVDGNPLMSVGMWPLDIEIG